MTEIKHADIRGIEGQLPEDTVDKIAREAATHIGALD